MEGELLQVASPSQVYLSPADPRVASFLGHASLLRGTGRGDGTATSALGSVPVRSGVGAGPLLLAVRAEQVHVRGSDGVAGEVLDVSFYGHDATVRLRLENGESLAARIPATTVPAPGDQVRVALLGDVVAFPA
jgi:iron(III) transport system ATP-binding protein